MEPVVMFLLAQPATPAASRTANEAQTSRFAVEFVLGAVDIDAWLRCVPRPSATSFHLAEVFR